jgi:hypothetical protein
MKYLITESQFDKVVFKYLDNHNFVKRKTPNIIYFLKSESDLRVDSLINYYKDDECWINFELVDEITKLFSLDFNDSKYIIGRWVANTLDARVKQVSIR